MAEHSTAEEFPDEASLEVDLKDPRLAAFLAWLIPGLGHVYQGRTGKGILFFVCIVGTFVFGLYIGQGRVVYASGVSPLSRQFYERWQYICQAGAGLPALPAYVQTWRVQQGKEPLFGEQRHFMRPPQMIPGKFTSGTHPNEVLHPHELAKWYYDLGDMFEMGTVFTVIAGLLNILAIYDAYGGPLVIAPRDESNKPATERPASV